MKVIKEVGKKTKLSLYSILCNFIFIWGKKTKLWASACQYNLEVHIFFGEKNSQNSKLPGLIHIRQMFLAFCTQCTSGLRRKSPVKFVTLGCLDSLQRSNLPKTRNSRPPLECISVVEYQILSQIPQSSQFWTTYLWHVEETSEILWWLELQAVTSIV